MIVIKGIVSALLIAGKAFAIMIFVLTALALLMILFIVMREVAWSVRKGRKQEEKKEAEKFMESVDADIQKEIAALKTLAAGKEAQATEAVIKALF